MTVLTPYDASRRQSTIEMVAAFFAMVVAIAVILAVPQLREIPAIAYAFFAGSYSENGSFSALAVVFCFMALVFIREKRLPLKFLLRFVSACAGFCRCKFKIILYKHRHNRFFNAVDINAIDII